MNHTNRAIIHLLKTRRVRINLSTGIAKVTEPDLVLKRRGYLKVKAAIDGGWYFVPVHRLVAYLKYGDRIFDPALNVHHKNFNPLDNRASNLCLVEKSLHRHWHHAQKLEQPGHD